MSVDPFDRCLTRRIDIGEEEYICIIECFGKLLLQKLRAGIAMRLEGTDDTVIACLSRCFQGCFDLCRMMCIVIYDGDIIDRSLVFKTAVRSGEGRIARPLLPGPGGGDRTGRGKRVMLESDGRSA